MSTYVYRDAQTYVVVVTGQPEAAVLVGTGDTAADAAADAQPTPIRSAGADPAGSALRWATHAGWVSSADLEAVR